MFSFFRSTKKSPDPIETATAATGDDFVVVPPQQPPPPRPTTAPGGGIYPSFGPTGIVPNHFGHGGAAAAGGQQPESVQRQQSDGGTFNYLQGVPFKLSGEIHVDGCRGGGDRTDVMRIEVDQILAIMTRAMDMYGAD